MSNQRYPLFGALAAILFACISGPAIAQDSQTLISNMLTASIAGNESTVLELKSRIELLPKPEKGDRKLSRSLNEAALKSLKAGDISSALTTFEKAVNADKSDVEVLNNLGFALLSQKQPEPAKKAILDSIALAPGRSAAWFNLGQAFGDLGGKAEATAAFDIAYTLSPNKEKTKEAIAKLASDSSSSSALVAAANESILHGGIRPSKAGDGQVNVEGAVSTLTNPKLPDVTNGSTEIPIEASKGLETKSLVAESNTEAATDSTGLVTAKVGDGLKNSSQTKPGETQTSQRQASGKSDQGGASENSTPIPKVQNPEQPNSIVQPSMYEEAHKTLMRTFDSLELKSLLPSDDQILEFGSLAFILTLIGIIFAGASGKIVIWFDLNDVFLTLGIFFPTFIAIFLSVLYKSDPTALYIIWGLAILLGGICAIKSLIQSVGHNHNVFIGVLVWVFKVLVSVITLILVLCRVVLALYGTGNSPNSRRPTTVFQIVIIGLFGYLMWSLVNGKRVYANKGWLVEEQPA